VAMRPVSGVLGVLRDLLADLGRGEPLQAAMAADRG
jgi:hypothetical protein